MEELKDFLHMIVDPIWENMDEERYKFGNDDDDKFFFNDDLNLRD